MSWAGTVNDGLKTGTATATVADVQAAFDYVRGKAQDGWVITIGAAGDNVTWTSAVDMGSGFANSVKIQSAGGDANKTTITLNFTDGGSGIILRVTDNKLVQFTGFRILTGAGQSFGTGAIGIRTSRTGQNRNSIRIDHCRFENCANHAIGVLYPEVYNSGPIYGLVDHCVFANTATHNGVYIHAGTPGTGHLDIGEWNNSMTWGTADTFTIEDCTFSLTGADTVEGNPANDSAWYGARWMARHNVFTNWVLVSHGADSAPSSTLQVEVLHNTFNLVTNDAVDFVMYTRGGSLRFYDNTVTLSNGATLGNQVVKTAIDTDVNRSVGFQQIGHGASGGTEVVEPDYFWGNHIDAGVTGPLVGAPQNNPGLWNLNTQYFLSAPGGFTELAYPHPLNTDGATSGVVTVSGRLKAATFKFS